MEAVENLWWWRQSLWYIVETMIKYVSSVKEEAENRQVSDGLNGGANTKRIFSLFDFIQTWQSWLVIFPDFNTIRITTIVSPEFGRFVLAIW